MKRDKAQWTLWILGLSVMVLLVSFFSLSIGAVHIPLKKIFGMFTGAQDPSISIILFDIRLPRIVLGCAVGGALALSGVILQGMFRNPLVEPYTLGIAGGAALGVSINVMANFYHTIGIIAYPLCGFVGSIAVVAIMYILSMKKNMLRIQGLLLTGVMISFICSSLIMLIMALSKAEDLQRIVYWMMGFLGDAQWNLVLMMGVIALLGLAASYIFCIDLNAMALGEEEARHLGVHTERTKKILFFIAAILIGASVSVTGIIGFVGLVVPHFVRLVIGRDHRILLICSFLCGAGFLVFCDTFARIIVSPIELPVGVITGICGGTLFIYAMLKRRVQL
ncbi:MAG: iron ABC transporter permease [Candidatus Ancaeobacter aquaticus]|nr:iron ABC transporter permease [Candidatus Ancaeobacter aquaticus]